MTPYAQIEDARERLNRSREIARAIEASLATETARKRGLVEVFLSRGLTLPPPPPNEASASADASEETLARENEGGDDIDDEKDANADEETIEGLKRALASSQARARTPTSWTPPWTPPSGSRVFVFMYACTCIFRTIGRIARAGPQIFARGAIFIFARNHHLFFNRCPDDRHIDARLSSPRPSRATELDRTERCAIHSRSSPRARRTVIPRRRDARPRAIVVVPGSRTRTPCSSTGRAFARGWNRRRDPGRRRR